MTSTNEVVKMNKLFLFDGEFDLSVDFCSSTLWAASPTYTTVLILQEQ